MIPWTAQHSRALGRLRLSAIGVTRRALSRKRPWVAMLSFIVFTGCGTPPGPIFEPLTTPIHWPPPPEQPRIAYVGSLATDRDLKAGRSFFDTVGQFLFGERPIEAMASPMAITSDGNGRVFICDSAGRLVHVYDLETRRYEQWQPEGGFTLPVGVAWYHGSPSRESSRLGEAGYLFVTDSAEGRIFTFDERGTSVGAIGSQHLTRPTGIVIDAQHDRIYVADAASHQIVILNMQGDLIDRLGTRGTGPGEFSFPTNVARYHGSPSRDSRLGEPGYLLVSDSLNFRIQLLGREGNFIRQIGERGNTPGHFSNPKGLATDSGGHIYVVDAHFEAVQIFNQEGQLLLVFGNEGRGPGEFWLPAGLHIDNQDRIWVADSFNRRVQVFQYLKEAQP